MYRIMVIEDNDKIRNELCDFLVKTDMRPLVLPNLIIYWKIFISRSQIYYC